MADDVSVRNFAAHFAGNIACDVTAHFAGGQRVSIACIITSSKDMLHKPKRIVILKLQSEARTFGSELGLKPYFGQCHTVALEAN